MASQLPPDVLDFTGRALITDELNEFLCADVESTRRAVPVAVVSGRGGVGKTALCVHAAHQIRDCYPDGQLYINLLGGESRPREPGDALVRFLRGLGVGDEAMPGHVDDRQNLYRSLVAGRRVLVVLDDAATEAQVRPLLPGEPGCGVVVSSRRQLLGLEGARHLDLDVLDLEEATALLAGVAGDRDLAAHHEATVIAEYCGRLPLALRVAGARLRVSGPAQVTWLRNRLADERGRLDELVVGDLEVRTSIAVGYRALDPPARRLFRYLGLLAAEDVGGWVALPLLDVEMPEAERLMAILVDSRLCDAVHTPAGPRYRLHDLVRLYARERAQEEGDDNAAVVRRALGAWLALAEAAEPNLPDLPNRPEPGTAARWTVPSDLAGNLLANPLAWFESEWPALAAGVQQAAAQGEDELAWELATSLDTFFMIRSLWVPWQATHQIALDACRVAGNRRGEANLLLGLAALAIASASYDRARALDEAALARLRETGDQHGEARALSQLALALTLSGDTDQGLNRAEESRRLALLLEDRSVEADAMMMQGRALLRLGRIDEAGKTLAELVDLAADLGARRAHAQALWQLALVRRAEEDPAGAVELLGRSLAVAEELRDDAGQGRILIDLAALEERRGHRKEALAALETAAELGRVSHTPVIEAEAAAALARLRRLDRQARLLGPDPPVR